MLIRAMLPALTAGAVLFSAHCAFGATVVSPVRGVTLVNDGKGFVEISGDVEVSPGTKVMVRHGGSAMIYYGNSCSAEVGSGRVWVVKENVDCDRPTGATGDSLPGGEAGLTSPEVMVLAGGMVVADGVAIGNAVNQANKDYTPPIPVSP